MDRNGYVPMKTYYTRILFIAAAACNPTDRDDESSCSVTGIIVFDMSCVLLFGGERVCV